MRAFFTFILCCLVSATASSAESITHLESFSRHISIQIDGTEITIPLPETFELDEVALGDPLYFYASSPDQFMLGPFKMLTIYGQPIWQVKNSSSDYHAVTEYLKKAINNPENKMMFIDEDSNYFTFAKVNEPEYINNYFETIAIDIGTILHLKDRVFAAMGTLDHPTSISPESAEKDFLASVGYLRLWRNAIIAANQ